MTFLDVFLQFVRDPIQGAAHIYRGLFCRKSPHFQCSAVIHTFLGLVLRNELAQLFQKLKKIDFLAQIVYNRINNGAFMISTAPFFSGGHIMKTIGVIPLIDYGRKSYWMIPGYLTGLQTVGALPIMLPVIESKRELQAVMEMCDGFLFTGGQDVAPA